MKVSAIATVFTLVLGAVALPENTIAAREVELEASTGLPQRPSSNACGQLCEGVVRRACDACKDSVCKTACFHGARMNKCLDCCRSRCVTC
ncbi:hypothetical protein C8A01DRAFT_17404 [Parachaetomium inaequale]|uniref:Uncharacterized protein n=1 Tax=Parachaetomium inaequale TaxID=2588326 RepID=A0AAN6PEF8_9PEZI|nr:hypothetical protein C8A01DRAFT_17404 [Parachaetomium inaequale]